MGASCQDIPLVPKAHNVFFQKVVLFSISKNIEKNTKKITQKGCSEGSDMPADRKNNCNLPERRSIQVAAQNLDGFYPHGTPVELPRHCYLKSECF